MLLTLATRSLAGAMSTSGGDALTLLKVPEYAIRRLRLRGLNVSASMLCGWSLDQLDRLRDAADKAACPCLVLVEDKPLPLGPAEEVREAAGERVTRLARAANRLGCNALGIQVQAVDDDQHFEAAAEELRGLMPVVERQELTILLVPGEGLTHSPQRLTELIKRVGGFRIGALPTFAHASQFDDSVDVLRRLAPYAGAISATIEGFDPEGCHTGCDLARAVHVIRSVGFVNTLAIDYVGTGDPLEDIARARDVLQCAIDEDA